MTNKEEFDSKWKKLSLADALGESSLFKDGDWIESKDQDPNGDVRLIQLADIGDGFFRNRSDRYLTLDKALELNCTFLNKNDVLVARMPDPIGRACLFPGDKKKCVTAVDVCIIRTNHIDHQWLMYAINSPQFRSDVESLQSGSTRKRISRKNLAKIDVSIPARNEQFKLVEKIEELFSQLDAGVAGLKRTQAGLKRYRMSVLNAAFEGRLVPQDPNEEPAGELLKNNNLKPNEFEKPYSLPDSWVWVKIEDVADTTSGGTPLRSKSEYFGGDIHWIKSGELRDNIIKDSDEKITELGLNESSAKIFKKGTTVVALYGATVGKTGILNINAATNQAVCAIFPKNNIILNKYLFYWFQYKRQELINLSIGGAQPNISQRIIRSLRFPLSPSKEQTRIVVEIERQMSIIENIKNSINSRITNASYLHQAILKSAFSGNLIIKTIIQ